MRARPCHQPLWALTLIVLCFAAGTATAAEPIPEEKLLAAGRRVFRWKCSFCHALDENHTGPRLRDVFGRRAGAVADFRYSPALAGSRQVWDAVTLDLWLSGPARFIPGARMAAQFPDRSEREAVIAYLRNTSIPRG